MGEMSKNLLTVLVAVIVSYAVLETVWRNSLHLVPLTLHNQLGRLQFLAQRSKSGVVPHDYTLIIGDSYAEGLGDWLMEVVQDGNPKYNAAHILHERTGKDFLSFGIRGGYPAFAYVLNTTRAFTGLNLYWGITVEPPETILAFFYEGNDVSDDIASIQHTPADRLDRSRLGDDRYLKRYILQLAEEGRRLAERRWHFLRNAHLFDTATKLVKLAIKNFGGPAVTIFESSDPRYAGRTRYSPDWSRYEGTRTFFRSDVGNLPYPHASVEPFAFHSPEQIEISARMFRHSLAYLKRQFPTARIWVVYIGSPIMAYDLVGGTAVLRDRIRGPVSEKPGPERVFTIAELVQASGRICAAIYRATEAVGARFIDTRHGIRAFARSLGHLHGPSDPGHLNKKGYAALAETILAGMRSGASTGCEL